MSLPEQTDKEIKCSDCGRGSGVNLSRDTFSVGLYLFNMKWESGGTGFICPSCAKKKLKGK